ncbi:hypothetical protein ACOMHN_043749 [Nucella lapillus]
MCLLRPSSAAGDGKTMQRVSERGGGSPGGDRSHLVQRLALAAVSARVRRQGGLVPEPGNYSSLEETVGSSGAMAAKLKA